MHPASFPPYKLSHKGARRIFLYLKIFLFEGRWMQKLISCNSNGTRYGTLSHHCGYLGYKKESRGLLRVSRPPLLANTPFLLPILTGQDLSKELNRQSQWHQFLLNPPLIHRQLTSPCGRIAVCLFTRLPVEPLCPYASVNPQVKLILQELSLIGSSAAQ